MLIQQKNDDPLEKLAIPPIPESKQISESNPEKVSPKLKQYTDYLNKLSTDFEIERDETSL